MENNEKPKPVPSTLADRLFGRGFSRNAREHLDQAREEMDRGASEQAGEHLRRAGISNARHLTSLTSPRLSEAENQEWLRLQNSKYFVDENGMISEQELNEKSEARLEELYRKSLDQS